MTRIEVGDLLVVRFALASLGLAVRVGHRLTLSRRLVVPGIGPGVLYGGAQVLQTRGLAENGGPVSRASSPDCTSWPRRCSVVWAAGFAVAAGTEVVTVRMVVGGLAILTTMWVAELPGLGRAPARR